MARNLLGGFYDPGKPFPSNAMGTSTNHCLLMQETKSLTVSLLDWGSTEPRNTRVPKAAVHKIVRHYSVHASDAMTQPFSCGGIKILHNG